ncbi:hypothetical protein [Edaphocola flava]|uniref:hypothetical protein n=1 Tax=Edaphocola flava TaxID=2499629 RepID=UPI00100A5AD8|nr:hypothetical protein [Edaphocola flava]
MAKFILIRSTINSGKTTTASLVYTELLQHAEIEHMFNSEQIKVNGLIYREDGTVEDFNAALTINGKTVCILSAGDNANDTKRELNWLLRDYNFDIIICCSRSQNKTGSVYRMLIEEYFTKHELILETSTNYTHDTNEMHSVKKDIVDDIVKKVLSEVNDTQIVIEN